MNASSIGLLDDLDDDYMQIMDYRATIDSFREETFKTCRSL